MSGGAVASTCVRRCCWMHGVVELRSGADASASDRPHPDGIGGANNNNKDDADTSRAGACDHPRHAPTPITSLSPLPTPPHQLPSRQTNSLLKSLCRRWRRWTFSLPATASLTSSEICALVRGIEYGLVVLGMAVCDAARRVGDVEEVLLEPLNEGKRSEDSGVPAVFAFAAGLAAEADGGVDLARGTADVWRRAVRATLTLRARVIVAGEWVGGMLSVICVEWCRCSGDDDSVLAGKIQLGDC